MLVGLNIPARVLPGSINLTHLTGFMCSQVPIWRRSFFANYMVLDVTSKRIFHISNPSAKLRHAQWRTGSSGNEILFVHDNNIFVRQYDEPESTQAITTSGVVDEVYCGVPDWVMSSARKKFQWILKAIRKLFQVYEEEVLKTNIAMHVSPNGKYLAYAQFDDKYVRKWQRFLVFVCYFSM